MAMTPALTESWVLYSLAAIVFFVRVILRTKQLGVRGWQGDDYLCIIAFMGFTYNTATFQVIEEYGVNIGITPESVAKLTPQELKRMEIGSLVDFFSWFAWITLLWGCKGCMLFLYSRVTIMLWQRKLVILAGWLVGSTFVGGYVTNIFKCGGDIGKNWRVKPYPGVCPAGAANLYFVGITNFLTDALILYIPLPILWKVNLPMKKKIFLFFMLCSGLFIVVISLLRCVYSVLTTFDRSDVGIALAWSTRENFTAMVIVNLPIIVTSLQLLRFESKSNSSRSHISTLRSGTNRNNFTNNGGGGAGGAASKGTELQSVTRSHVAAGNRISYTPPGHEKQNTYVVYAEADEEELLTKKETRRPDANHRGDHITVVRTVTVASGRSADDTV